MIDPPDYGYGNLPRYLGSRYSAVGVVLFFLGGACLLVSALYLAMGDYSRNDLPLAGYPLWGVVAVPLGLSLRRKEPSQWRWFLAIVWIGAAIISMIAAEANGI